VLSALMILAGDKADSYEEAREMTDEVISNGKALEKFKEVCQLHGGDVSVIDHPESYPVASEVIDIPAEKAGYVHHVDAYSMGYLGIVLGAGRLTKEDPVDPQAGIVMHKHIGDKVKTGDILCTLHTNKKKLADARKIAVQAYDIQSRKPEMAGEFIYKIITDKGVEDWQNREKLL